MDTLSLPQQAKVALPGTRNKTFYVLCGLIAFFVGAGASFGGFYTKFHFREPYPPAHVDSSAARLDALLTGKASRPYVYRQLIPTVANAIDAVVPPDFKTRLYEMRTPRGKPFRERFFLTDLARNQTFYFRYLIVYLLTFLSAFAATWLMYRVVRFFIDDVLVAGSSAVMMILLMPFLMNEGGYYYDYSELAFLSLTVLVALEFRWLWLIPIALFAAWNKESYLLYVPCIYPLLRSRLSRKTALVATAVTGLASMLVVFALRLRYGGNPGGAVEFHLFDQLSYFSHPLKMLTPNDSTYGLVFLPSLNPFSLVFIALMVRYGWPHLPSFLKRHTAVAAAINLPLYLLFCYPGELRDLSFLYIPFLVLMANLLDQLRPETKSAPVLQRV